MKVDTSNCLKPCSGLIVTSFSKSEKNKDLDALFSTSGFYDKYKKVTPSATIGKIRFSCTNKCVKYMRKKNCLDSEWKNKLRFVRVYFDTPTFDRITKDRAAKFTDMLSAIGGTIFSIGKQYCEINYFFHV